MIIKRIQSIINKGIFKNFKLEFMPDPTDPHILIAVVQLDTVLCIHQDEIEFCNNQELENLIRVRLIMSLVGIEEIVKEKLERL